MLVSTFSAEGHGTKAWATRRKVMRITHNCGKEPSFSAPESLAEPPSVLAILRKPIITLHLSLFYWI